LTLTLTF